jgi:hypothetical protein
MGDEGSCGARFASHQMAANYRFRPDYSTEIYDILAGLLRGQPRSLLDAGCGPGKSSAACSIKSIEQTRLTPPQKCCTWPVVSPLAVIPGSGGYVRESKTPS